jgi:carboxyl-terminal processing protease
MFEYGVQDPFSGYMSPEDYQRALGDLSGQFSGIGAEMGVRNLENPEDLEACTTFSDTCALVVVAPLEDSPAEEAGLQAGDIVTAIDGQSVEGLSLEDAVKQVRGEPGTQVTLSLRRDDEPLEMTITRAEITLREVTSRMLQDGIGYVALHGFSNPSSTQFHEAIGELLDEGATSLVFDLRDNPGGYIDAANKIASEFISSGLVFTQESAADGVKRWEATGDGLATDPSIPVVVLVNNGSASASEIVSAALKERGRATVIGQHTYGKNTVQLWDPLDNGGGVRITISRWFTPEHNSVAPDGVQPDIVVEVPDGTPPERDLFVERAVEFLTDRALGEDGAQPSGSPAEPSPAGLLPFTSPVSYDPSGQAVATF